MGRWGVENHNNSWGNPVQKHPLLTDVFKRPGRLGFHFDPVGFSNIWQVPSTEFKPGYLPLKLFYVNYPIKILTFALYFKVAVNHL